jgi:hypothetical protein
MLATSMAQAKTEEREANIVEFAVSTPNPTRLNALALYILHAALPLTSYAVKCSDDISANATPHPEGLIFVFTIPVTCENTLPRRR